MLRTLQKFLSQNSEIYIHFFNRQANLRVRHHEFFEDSKVTERETESIGDFTIISLHDALNICDEICGR